MSSRWIFLGLNTSTGNKALFYSDDLITVTLMYDLTSGPSVTFSKYDISSTGQFVPATSGAYSRTFQLTRTQTAGSPPLKDEMLFLLHTGISFHSLLQKDQISTLTPWYWFKNARDLNGLLCFAANQEYTIYFVLYGSSIPTINYRSDRWKEITSYDKTIDFGGYLAGLLVTGATTYVDLHHVFLPGNTWRISDIDYVKGDPSLPDPPSIFYGYENQTAVNWLTPDTKYYISTFAAQGSYNIYTKTSTGLTYIDPSPDFEVGMKILVSGNIGRVYKITNIVPVYVLGSLVAWYMTLDNPLIVAANIGDTIEQTLEDYDAEIEIELITAATELSNRVAFKNGGFVKGDTTLPIVGTNTGYGTEIGVTAYNYVSFQGIIGHAQDTSDSFYMNEWRYKATLLSSTTGQCSLILQHEDSPGNWVTKASGTVSVGNNIIYDGILPGDTYATKMRLSLLLWNATTMKATFFWIAEYNGVYQDNGSRYSYWGTEQNGNYILFVGNMNASTGQCIAKLYYQTTSTLLVTETIFNVDDTLIYNGDATKVPYAIKYLSYNSIALTGTFLWDENQSVFTDPIVYAAPVDSTSGNNLLLSRGLPIAYSAGALVLWDITSKEWNRKQFSVDGSVSTGSKILYTYRPGTLGETPQFEDLLLGADIDVSFEDTKTDTNNLKRQYDIASISEDTIQLETGLLEGLRDTEILYTGYGNPTQLVNNQPISVEFGDDGELYVYTSATGVLTRYKKSGATWATWANGVTEEWSITIGTAVYTEIFYFKNSIYITVTRNVYRYDAATGTLLNSFGNIGFATNIDDNGNMVVVDTAHPSEFLPPTYSDGLKAYNRLTGALITSYLTGSLANTTGMVLVLERPPEVTGILINSGDEWTTSANVTLVSSPALWVPTITEMRIKIDTKEFGTDIHGDPYPWIEGSWQSWESYSLSKSIILSAGDNEKRVTAQYRNAHGTGPDLPQDNIKLDSNAPTNVSIEITPAETNQLQVTLTLNADETVSPPIYMMISNLSDLSGAAWESFSYTKAWTLLSGPEGQRTVYARFKIPLEILQE